MSDLDTEDEIDALVGGKQAVALCLQSLGGKDLSAASKWPQGSSATDIPLPAK